MASFLGEFNAHATHAKGEAMIFQDEIWYIAVAGMLLCTLVFIYVISQASKPAETRESQKKPYSLRRWLFLVLLVVFVGVSYATLHRFPIPLQHDPLEASQVIDVVGHQWYWEMSAAQIQAGSTVEFRVTSADVNHGFAIYAPDGRIAIQTQAMPGYTNKLLYTFDEPGTYTIRCLEYCGLAHHSMAATLNVIAAAAGGHSP